METVLSEPGLPGVRNERVDYGAGETERDMAKVKTWR